MAYTIGGVETVTVQKSELKSIIAGMMLGDGGLFILKHGKNAVLKIQHSIKQEPYLLHKAALLAGLTSIRVNLIAPKGKKNPNWNIALATKAHPFYTRVHKLVYPGGKKTVNKTWLSWLDERGLALWYMDDGTLMKSYSHNKSGRWRIKSRHIKLCTCGFTLEENELLKEFLQERFDLKFFIVRSGKYYNLGASPREANKLFEIIRPYIVPCMEYKLNMEYEQSNEGHLVRGEEPVRPLRECREVGGDDLPPLLAE